MASEKFKDIGRYRIDKMIGRGSMGVVYLGHDEMIDREVAIKSLRLDKIKTPDDRKRAQEMFFQEVKTVGKMNHSHITTIYDVGMQEDSPYMVMEYVAGRTVKSLITKTSKYSLKERVGLISMIARGLHYAHQHGIVHRDIKPANVMILPNNAPKIMDFGIAVIKSAASTEWTSSASEEGLIMGTPFYMSPEQIRGKELDPRSDIFSLGIFAYEWLSGQKPFSGKDLTEILTNIVKNPHKPLGEVCKADSELEGILDRMLSKEKDSRYDSADEVSDALELYLNKLETEHAQTKALSVSYDKLKIVQQLKKNYMFFSDFTEEELLAIFKMSGKEMFKAGSMVFDEGTSGAKMYIIISGKVSILREVKGEEMEIKKLEVGECFGEMAIIDKMPRSASVKAVEDTVVVAINEIVLRVSDPKLCLKLFRNLASMVSEKLRIADTKYFDLLASTRGK